MKSYKSQLKKCLKEGNAEQIIKIAFILDSMACAIRELKENQCENSGWNWYDEMITLIRKL